MKIGAGTELLGVVGHPVSHTLSPAFWNPALEQAGKDAVFLAFDVSADDFPAFVAGMSAAGARGLNVTMPHKDQAFALADRVSPEAERTGAVNCLVLQGEAVVGHNTDVHGLRSALLDLGIDPSGARTLLLGGGGAARAAALALSDAGASVMVANRTPSKAEEIATRFGAQAIDWQASGETASAVQLIVNATSIGLSSEDSPLYPSALEKAAAGGCWGVFDVVYKPEETRLVKEARAAGLPASDGLGMLVHQAAQAYRLFYTEEPPLEVMMAAARRAAGRAS